jgi:hypothetical protein
MAERSRSLPYRFAHANSNRGPLQKEAVQLPQLQSNKAYMAAKRKLDVKAQKKHPPSTKSTVELTPGSGGTVPARAEAAGPVTCDDRQVRTPGPRLTRSSRSITTRSGECQFEMSAGCLSV